MSDNRENWKTRLRPFFRPTLIGLILIILVFAAVRMQNWNRASTASRALTLVNPWNPVSETGYAPRLVSVENDFQADRSCASQLKQMLRDCRAAGHRPLLLSAYRTVDDQLVLYDEAVQESVESGMSPAEAEEFVSLRIARPGRSEHELGLAFDLVDEDYPYEDAAQASTPTSRWLSENAWRYGFILRYPAGSEDVTGYSWHPWHYRYVGVDAAENLHILGISLEEYLSLFYSGETAVVGN